MQSFWILPSISGEQFCWDLKAAWHGSCRRDRSQPVSERVPAGKPDPLPCQRHASAVHSSFLLHFSQLKHCPAPPFTHTQALSRSEPFPVSKVNFYHLDKAFFNLCRCPLSLSPSYLSPSCTLALERGSPTPLPQLFNTPH